MTLAEALATPLVDLRFSCTGEKKAVKAGATVKFKVSPALKEEVLAGLKKAKRKAEKATKGE